MMAHAGLPDNYRAEAVDAVVYIRNHTSTSHLYNSLSSQESKSWTYKSIWLHGLCPHT